MSPPAAIHPFEPVYGRIIRFPFAEAIRRGIRSRYRRGLHLAPTREPDPRSGPGRSVRPGPTASADPYLSVTGAFYDFPITLAGHTSRKTKRLDAHSETTVRAES